jgi:hypothetical protein
MEFLTWLENLAVVTWVREADSLLGYTLFLALHTIGLVFLIGPNLVIGARVLGLVPDLPLRPMSSFRPLMTVGLWLTVFTGLVLFATAPVSYVRNVVFIVKIASIVLAVICLRGVTRGLLVKGDEAGERPVTSRIKQLTAASLFFWVVAVVAGRLTAYSPVVVLESLGAFFTVVVPVLGAATLVGVLRSRRSHSQAGALPLDVQPTPANGGK